MPDNPRCCPVIQRMAMFLAYQAWSISACCDPRPDHALSESEKAKRAMSAVMFVESKWREFTGPAKLMIDNCYRRPTEFQVRYVAKETGIDAGDVRKVLDCNILSILVEYDLERSVAD